MNFSLIFMSHEMQVTKACYVWSVAFPITAAFMAAQKIQNWFLRHYSHWGDKKCKWHCCLTCYGSTYSEKMSCFFCMIMRTSSHNLKFMHLSLVPVASVGSFTRLTHYVRRVPLLPHYIHRLLCPLFQRWWAT